VPVSVSVSVPDTTDGKVRVRYRYGDRGSNHHLRSAALLSRSPHPLAP